MMAKKTPPSAGRLIRILLLVGFAVYILIPISWMLASSLRSPLDSFKMPPAILPTQFLLDSYNLVFEKVDFGKFLKNSVIVSLSSTALQVVCSSMAAFAFSRFRFPGKNVLFIAFLCSMMVPSAVMSIQRFIIMKNLGLIDRYGALILPAMFSAIGIFMIRQFMMTIPKSYDEAAYIDGAGRIYCFFRIVGPMAKPAMMVIAVQTFIGTWNDFYNPLIFINSESKMTLPLGLTALWGRLGTGSRSAVLAGVILSLIPPLLFYVAGQRFLIEGINLGGLKG